MTHLLGTILLACATDPITVPDAPPPITCHGARRLSGAEAFQFFDLYEELVDLQRETAEDLELPESGSSQEEMDAAWGNLGSTLGELRVLCGCNEQLVLTPDCHALEDVFQQFFD